MRNSEKHMNSNGYLLVPADAFYKQYKLFIQLYDRVLALLTIILAAQLFLLTIILVQFG